MPSMAERAIVVNRSGKQWAPLEQFAPAHGLAVPRVLDLHPGRRVRGVEPVPALGDDTLQIVGTNLGEQRSRIVSKVDPSHCGRVTEVWRLAGGGDYRCYVAVSGAKLVDGRTLPRRPRMFTDTL